MNGYQIISIVNSLPETKYSFLGCFKNDTIPFELQLKRNGFFIVNTTVKISSMGHWILFYIKDCVLYFFDSFGQSLDIYGLDIESFYTSYTGPKIKVFNSPLQDDMSYVCGPYVIYFAYMMSKNHSTYYIKSRFNKNKKRNDTLVTKFIFLKTKIEIRCNLKYCSGYMFNTKCRKFCSC